MGKSDIEWTDETWNPVRGCTKVSPGCKHCYAETFAERFEGTPGHPYERGFAPRTAPDKLDEPLHWRAPRRVFVNSMSDLFHESFSFDYIDSVFAIMQACPQHTFQVLTKRADRMREYMVGAEDRVHDAGSALAGEKGWCHAHEGGPWPLPNVWSGVSVENQEYADRRISDLLATPAAVRFLSCEPLLGPVDLTEYLALMDLVIVGGESGNGARPCNIAWIRPIATQCKTAGVAFFLKQLGANVRWDGFAPAGGWWPAGTRLERDGSELKRVRLNSKKGGDMLEWPMDMRVREMPAVRSCS